MGIVAQAGVEMNRYLWIPHIEAENVNAVQSPFVWGFPGPLTWLGFADWLQRELRVQLGAVGIMAHRFEPQTYGGFVKRFCQPRLPLKKSGDVGSIVEEGRAHLEASILIEWIEGEFDANVVEQTIRRARLAGGPVRGLNAVQLINSDTEIESGSWLQVVQTPVSSMDDWIEKTQPRWAYDNEWTWERPEYVPLHVGYASLEAPRQRQESRNPAVPLYRVEALHGLGVWLKTADKQAVLFKRQANLETGVFLCVPKSN